jgi:hypothetical protein
MIVQLYVESSFKLLRVYFCEHGIFAKAEEEVAGGVERGQTSKLSGSATARTTRPRN